MVFSIERLVWLTPQKYTEMATFNFGNVCAAKKYFRGLVRGNKSREKAQKTKKED